jgi:ComF family protein
MIRKLVQPYLEVLFPPVCCCCGERLQQSGRHICDLCRSARFETALIEKPEILPDFVMYRYAMWMFDQGGYLQDLVHHLKYNYLKTVGIELGQILGEQFMRQISALQPVIPFKPQHALVVPVPLHKSKERKRGYNQARAIADGFAKATGWPLIEPGIIIREKRTKTQTGLSMERRSENLRGAFRVSDTGRISGLTPIIIDDVMTTGATTFELARILSEHTDRPIIATVARA